MDKEPTTSGLDPDKLQYLLRFCSEPDQAKGLVDSDQRKAELLQDLLAGTLPIESPIDNMSEQFITLCKISGINSENTVRDLLLDPRTNLRELKTIRDYFKKKSKSADSDTEQTATAIYYAAIAQALIVHDLKITKFSYKDLLKAYSLLIETKWIPPDLSDLYRKACEYCQDKS